MVEKQRRDQRGKKKLVSKLENIAEASTVVCMTWDGRGNKKKNLSKRGKINTNGHEESEVKKTKMMTEREWNGTQGKHTAAIEANDVTEEHRHSTDNDKDEHDGKRPPYFLLTFLCAG